jgi:hypothetical protein
MTMSRTMKTTQTRNAIQRKAAKPTSGHSDRQECTEESLRQFLDRLLVDVREDSGAEDIAESIYLGLLGAMCKAQHPWKVKLLREFVVKFRAIADQARGKA